MTTAIATKPASDKQLTLIRDLLAGATNFDLAAWLDAHDLLDTADLTGGRDGTASALITALFAAKPAREGTSRKDPEPGLYRVDGEIVRIKLARSGNWYAQQATKRPGRTTFAWEYLGKRINMADAEPIADDEAGRFLGYCVRCCAELTDPDSIARGLGPVCAKKGV